VRLAPGSRSGEEIEIREKSHLTGGTFRKKTPDLLTSCQILLLIPARSIS